MRRRIARTGEGGSCSFLWIDIQIECPRSFTTVHGANYGRRDRILPYFYVITDSVLELFLRVV